MKKPKYLMNRGSDSQFSTPSASRASSPQNSDDGYSVSRRTSARSTTRRGRPSAAASATPANSKRGGHSGPSSQGRRGERDNTLCPSFTCLKHNVPLVFPAYESEYHYGSDFGDSSDDQEQEDDPFMASASDSESVDAVDNASDSDFSMSSYSTHSNANNANAKKMRQPTPDPVWLQEIDVPELELPKSSDDLMAPQHLVLRITALYEVLRRFRNLIRLSPFRLEDFCAALVCEEQSALLSEIHMMLLKTIIREEDTQSTHFGPLDQKDSVNISLYLMDSYTWPEVMRSYVESDPQFDPQVLAVLSDTEYPFCDVEDRLRVLQFLIDQVLITSPVRDMLLQEGPIQYDDHCRICHRLGDLLCCETCPAVYHLECVDPPLTDVPTEDWQCNICKEHKVSGVNDCLSQQEKQAMLCRQDHLGYDRHGRKYWFVARRLFVETEDGAQTWYYSTIPQLEALLERLDEDSLELGLCAEINELRPEMERQMELTESLTNECKGGKKSYLEVLNERLANGGGGGDGEEEQMESDEGEAGGGGRDGDAVAGRMTRNRLQQISTGRLYFKLGMENTFKTYENQFATNINALNKPQRNEERDKKRHLSHKFSLTDASQFKWHGGSSTTVQNIILALRGTILHLEQNIPAPYMHPNWPNMKKVWTQAAVTAESAKDFTKILLVLQTCMKSCMFANVWYEALGHTRLYRITSNEREEKKKQEKREKRDCADEEERNRWANNFVRYTLGMKHQCWKQKGEEYRIHGQWSWMWLSANRRQASQKRGKVQPAQFCIQPQRIMTKVRTTEGKVQVIDVCPVTLERLIEGDVEEDCGVAEVLTVPRDFEYIDVCAALTSSSRILYPKVGKRSKLDVLLTRRTALLEAEEKQMVVGVATNGATATDGPTDVEDAVPKHQIGNLPNVLVTEADLLRIMGEKGAKLTAAKAAQASKASASAEALNSIMKEVIPIRTLYGQLNKLGKNLNCYSQECNPGPQLVLTKASNCYSPLCMQKDRVRQDLLNMIRRGHSLGISSKDMLNNRLMSAIEQQQAAEADEAGILDLPTDEEKVSEVVDADDIDSIQSDLKRALEGAVDYDDQEFKECLTKKAFEFEMEEKAIVDEKMKHEEEARAAVAEQTKAVVKLEPANLEIKQEPLSGGDNKDMLNDPADPLALDQSLTPTDSAEPTPKRSLRGRPPKPKNLKMREERAAALAENGGEGAKNGLPEEKTHKWSVLKPKRRFMNKGPRMQVKLEPELGPNGVKREYSVKCTQGKISLRKQLKARPPTTGPALNRGTKGRLTNKFPVVGNFLAKTGRRSILILPKHELLHVARCGGRVVPIGYNPMSKTNIAVWPYPSPRPLFRSCWIYRMLQAETLNALCLGLRVMWACMRWDDMQTKPTSVDGKNQIMNENEIVNLELLKHRHVGRHMERTQYLRRKVIIPLELPKAVREVTSIRLGLRKRKRADSPQHTEPQVTEEWIDEEKLDLWEIRQYGER